MPTLVPVCPGTITETLEGALQCSEAWQTITAPVFFDFSQIDPAVMGEALGAGFFVSFTPLFIAWGGKLLYLSIRGK